MSSQLLASEKQIVRDYVKGKKRFPEISPPRRPAAFDNPASEEQLGAFRDLDRRKTVTADIELIEELQKKHKSIPCFLEAGPRKKLVFGVPNNGQSLNVAVVTAGGLAPGLNSVVHSIVERHDKTYAKLLGNGKVYGFLDSFNGLAGDSPSWMQLHSDDTEKWLDKGGSELGNMRGIKENSIDDWAKSISEKLKRWSINILYVIGGDGSLGAAHAIARAARDTIVVGIPKTMDNDILWVWQSFGFNTAVERAAHFINALHDEVQGTRRVCVVEFFGAQSGFVAANAALASGHVDLVMIPEVFGTNGMTAERAIEILREYRKYLRRRVLEKHSNAHGLVVLAEGVATELERLNVKLNGKNVRKDQSAEQITTFLGDGLFTMANRPVITFHVEPRYYVRAYKANAHDQVYCKRLGALAVDNALAGFTDFMISQWLTEYVLVPLELVAGGRKRVPTGGIFWKQVVASTGQPSFP